MPQPTQSPPHLLVAEDDEELNTVLLDLLTEEGYAVTSAASLDEALAQVSTRVFDLILTDILVWNQHAPLQGVEQLRTRAQPTPVCLLTGWGFSEEDARAQGFACLIKKPFDVDDLLARVAEMVARPLTPEQERQADVVRRYCQAIDARDWQQCAGLCREDVRYYPSPDSPFDRHQEVVGRAALLEQFDYNAVVAPNFHYTAYSLYGRPDGIAARYLATITTPEGTKPLAGSVLFQVEDGLIAQIGYRLDEAHQRAWNHIQHKQRENGGA
jgi:CheY-like chemotaxis protein